MTPVAEVRRDRTASVLLAIEKLQKQLDAQEAARFEPIAIIGLSCRFPAAADARSFWQMLLRGGDTISEVPPERWDIDAYYDPDPDAPGKMSSRCGAFLEGNDRFDAAFFGIAPREALSLDPQQRLLLEVSWEALEVAGLSAQQLSGSQTGVFIGISSSDYVQRLLGSATSASDAYLGTGNAHSVAAGRLSYVLGFQGPCMAVDTACSSSLVAVAQACDSLRTGRCILALAGGVNALLSPHASISFSKARMLAPDGRCKTFDSAADGYGRGEGCGVVVLKRLSDAQRDGDPVQALIRGYAVNQDGHSQGLTAPNGPSQQRVIRDALINGKLDPHAVQYVEAHGTGTALGDPIEVQALAAVLGEGRPRERPLLIGSVKTNIGHLEAAAGIAGLIKVVLALQHGEIPPHLHFRQPNPHIPWEQLAVQVTHDRTPWPTGTGRRIAGVSSFGFAGTNAHVVLEEAPAPVALTPPPGLAATRRVAQILALSARNPAALRELAERYARWLEEHGEADLADVCYTANTGRSHFEHRAAVVCANVQEACQQLAVLAAGTSPALRTGEARDRPALAFLFADRQALYPGMARELYETEPIFRAALKRCSELLREHLERPLADILFAENALLEQDAFAEPALFAAEHALAELWRAWGIGADVVLGLGVGEYVAACVAGIFRIEDGLRLAVRRGRLLDALRNDPTPGHAESALAEFEAFALTVAHRPAGLCLVCSLTGQVLEPGQTLTAEYWRRHVGQTGLLDRSVRTLAERGCVLVLEPGPATALGRVQDDGWPADKARPVYLAGLERGRGDGAQLQEALAGLYVRGITPDFVALDRPWRRRKLALPTYPFQRQRYWIEAAARPECPEPDRLAECLYEVKWTVAQQGAATTPARQSSRWLILADSKGVGTALAELFEAQGQACRVVAGASLEDASARAWDALLAEAGTGDGPLEVVHLGSLDTPVMLTPETLAVAERLSVGSALQLIQALARRQHPARLWLVTRAAQAVHMGADVEPAQAPLWGLGKGIALEHPHLWGGLIDLPAGADTALARPLLEALLADDAEDLLALRDGQRFVARLQRGSPPEPSRPLRLREDAAYLITGGLGSLGLHVARWLAERGARHLVLLGRNGLPTRPPALPASDEEPDVRQRRALLDELRKRGTSVHVVAADVSNRDALASACSMLQTLPPLRGVIHAAGVASLETLEAMSVESLHAALSAKVLGAWNVHELTRACPLDFFVCFSSVAAVWGSLGQAHYAAANAFLDALIQHRRCMRLPGLSVAFGPWSGGGMASEEALARLAQSGLRALSPQFGLRALEALLATGARQTVVADVDWQPFQALYHARRRRRLLAEIPTRPAARAREPGRASHPLLGTAQHLATGEVVYSSEFSLAAQPFLAEHIVHGTPVAPGATYVALALAAVGTPTRVRDLSIHHPLFFREQEVREVQCLLSSPKHGLRTFAVYSAAAGGRTRGWVLHAQCTLQTLETPAGAGEPLPELRARLQRQSMEEFYAECSRRGLYWGPMYRAVQALWINENEALGEVVVADALALTVGSLPAHPALLDGSMHVGMALSHGSLGDEVFLPVRYEQLDFWAPLPRRFSCHVRQRPLATPLAETQVCDLRWLDEAGRPLGELRGLVGKRATREALVRSLRYEERDPALGLGNAAEGTSELIDELRRASRVEREAIVTRHVQDEVARVLALSSLPDPRRGFFDLGMDSLMAVELAKRLRAQLGDALALPTTLVFEVPTVEALSRHLLHELLKNQLLPQEPGHAKETSKSPDERAEQLRLLSDEELDSLLSAKAAAILTEEGSR